MYSFNQNICKWNVSIVTDMDGMFYQCNSFNQNIEVNVGKVTNMYKMFRECSEFNQTVSWDVSNVTDIYNFLKIVQVLIKTLEIGMLVMLQIL